MPPELLIANHIAAVVKMVRRGNKSTVVVRLGYETWHRFYCSYANVQLIPGGRSGESFVEHDRRENMTYLQVIGEYGMPECCFDVEWAPGVYTRHSFPWRTWANEADRVQTSREPG